MGSIAVVKNKATSLIISHGRFKLFTTIVPSPKRKTFVPVIL
jgi:hypothetical protein